MADRSSVGTDRIIWGWHDSRTTVSGIDFTSVTSDNLDTVIEYDPRRTFLSLDTLSVNVIEDGSANYFGYDLSECAIYPLVGMQGFNAPPISFIEDRVPDISGSILRKINVDQRRIDIPLLLKAPNRQTLSYLYRTLTSNLMQARETGVLIFDKDSRNERRIFCTYADGMMGDANDDNEFVVWAKVMLSFVGHDPFVYEVRNAVSLQTYATNPPQFLTNATDHLVFFPADLAASSFASQQTIINEGDGESWPIWIMEGPIGGDLVLTNQTTGKVLTLVQSGGYSVVAGERVLIDTRPGFKSITSSVSGDIFGRLSNLSSMWSLVPGENVIKMDGTNTTAATRLFYRFDIPYFTI